MNRLFLPQGAWPSPQPAIHANCIRDLRRGAVICAVAALLAAGAASASLRITAAWVGHSAATTPNSVRFRHLGNVCVCYE
jgi:hypothetical protein